MGGWLWSGLWGGFFLPSKNKNLATKIAQTMTAQNVAKMR